MESNKPTIETKDLIEIKNLLEKRNTQFNKDQIDELRILLDKEIERNKDEKLNIQENYIDQSQSKIEIYKDVLKILNYSAMFAAFGASGGAVLAGTAIGSALLPGVGTIIGALIPLIGMGVKAIVKYDSNGDSESSEKSGEKDK